jgi:hypothetical protein
MGAFFIGTWHIFLPIILTTKRKNKLLNFAKRGGAE